MTNAPEPCTAAERQPRHLELDDAINNLDYLISQAEDLLSRIRGVVTVKSDKVDPPREIPSLETVLASGGDNIRVKRTQIEQILNEIESALF